MIPYVLTVSEEEEQLARGIADVQSLEVARVYAEALLNAAEKAGQAEEVLAEFEALLQTIEAPRSVVRKFLASGVISRETRADAIRKQLGLGCNRHGRAAATAEAVAREDVRPAGWAGSY